MSYVWDKSKALKNYKKHAIRFSDAIAVFLDDFALTIEDEFSAEERFITPGSDAFGRVLVVFDAFRGETTRLISARLATFDERRQYEGDR